LPGRGPLLFAPGEIDSTPPPFQGRLNRAEYLIPLLEGQWSYHLQRAEHRRALVLAKQLEDIGRQQTNDAALLLGHRMHGLTLTCMGELHRAHELYEQCYALSDLANDGAYEALMVRDPEAIFGLLSLASKFRFREIETTTCRDSVRTSAYRNERPKSYLPHAALLSIAVGRFPLRRRHSRLATGATGTSRPRQYAKLITAERSVFSASSSSPASLSSSGDFEIGSSHHRVVHL
jgi:hypothetical protein